MLMEALTFIGEPLFLNQQLHHRIYRGKASDQQLLQGSSALIYFCHNCLLLGWHLSLDCLPYPVPAHPAFFSVPRPIDSSHFAFHIVERHKTPETAVIASITMVA